MAWYLFVRGWRFGWVIDVPIGPMSTCLNPLGNLGNAGVFVCLPDPAFGVGSWRPELVFANLFPVVCTRGVLTAS